jgi:hypothetical protein
MTTIKKYMYGSSRSFADFDFGPDIIMRLFYAITGMSYKREGKIVCCEDVRANLSGRQQRNLMTLPKGPCVIEKGEDIFPLSYIIVRLQQSLL